MSSEPRDKPSRFAFILPSAPDRTTLILYRPLVAFSKSLAIVSAAVKIGWPFSKICANIKVVGVHAAKVCGFARPGTTARTSVNRELTTFYFSCESSPFLILFSSLKAKYQRSLSSLTDTPFPLINIMTMDRQARRHHCRSLITAGYFTGKVIE
jgi:hypothetical protein